MRLQRFLPTALGTLVLLSGLSVAAVVAPPPYDPLPEAKTFGKLHVLVEQVTCEKSARGGPVSCTASINPGVTVAPFTFVCEASTGCYVPVSGVDGPNPGCVPVPQPPAPPTPQ
jgi:hypothetical protein